MIDNSARGSENQAIARDHDLATVYAPFNWVNLKKRFGGLCRVILGRPAPTRNAALDVLDKVLNWTQLDLTDRLRAVSDVMDLVDGGALAEITDKPHDEVIRVLSRSFKEVDKEVRFQEAQARSRIRELYLAEIFPGIEEVSIPIGAINEETGHANATDLLFVSAIARWQGAKRPFEIGTYLGRTTYHLTYASEGAVVTTVNLPPESDPAWGPFQQSYFRGREREAQIRQIWADSTKLDTAPYRGQMDFVFIDGDHRYEPCKADTERAFELLAPGGIVVWHDYAAKSPGVYEFMEEFTQDRPLFRIRKTCLLLHMDGVDPMTFQALPMRPSKEQRFMRKTRSSAQAA